MATCIYNGILTCPFRTYTTTYPALNGVWNFNPTSQVPMEFWGFATPSGGLASGLYANIIDYNTGYTTIAIGDNDLAHTSLNVTESFGWAQWTNNRLMGWVFGNRVLVKAPAVYDYSATLGTSYTLPILSPNRGVQLEHHLGEANTGAPLPGFSPNMPVPIGGVVTGALQQLVRKYFLYIGGGQIIGPLELGYDISSQFFVVNGIQNYNGLAYNWCTNPSSGTSTLIEGVTEYLGAAVALPVVFINPPGNLDVDTILHESGSIPNPGKNGFVLIRKETVTVEDKTLVGYGLYVSPDFSTYQVLELLPTDAGGQNWTTQTGEFENCSDPSGALWIKNANSANTLYVVPPPQIKVIPLFYPNSQPDMGDTETTLLMMRGNPT